MAAVRALKARVRRLERSPDTSLRAAIGSFEKFEHECQIGVELGKFDKRDMPVVVKCVKRWIVK